VTTALAYFKNRYGERTPEWGKTIESIVLFTPRAIRDNKRVDSFYNDYNKIGVKHRFEDENVVQTVIKFVEREIKAIMPDRGKIYWCEVFAEDYEQSFRSAAEAILTRLSKKLLWLNLTGGTNIMNAALLQVASLSGLIARAYYALVDKPYLGYLQPAGEKNFTLHNVPLIKTTFDETHHAVLLTLKALDGKDWISSEHLLGFIKQDENYGRYFQNVELEHFKQEILKKMDGRGLKRRQLENGQKTYEVQLTDEGKQFLELVDGDLFRALTHRGEVVPDLPLTYGWEELWTKSSK
jgi:hypothetical protein